jgi:uncharacterized protein YaaR (DUF327 family)
MKIYPYIKTEKAEKFCDELKALFEKHQMHIAAEAYDNLQIWGNRVSDQPHLDSVTVFFDSIEDYTK